MAGTPGDSQVTCHLNSVHAFGFLVEDGDLATIALHMIRVRGLDTVRVTKVKEHATDADVDSGRGG